MCYLFLKDHVLLYRHDYEMKHKQFFRNIWKYHFWSNNHLDQNNVLFKLLSKKKITGKSMKNKAKNVEGKKKKNLS